MGGLKPSKGQWDGLSSNKGLFGTPKKEGKGAKNKERKSKFGVGKGPVLRTQRRRKKRRHMGSKKKKKGEHEYTTKPSLVGGECQGGLFEGAYRKKSQNPKEGV